jgi:hypothetical protein
MEIPSLFSNFILVLNEIQVLVQIVDLKNQRFRQLSPFQNHLNNDA